MLFVVYLEMQTNVPAEPLSVVFMVTWALTRRKYYLSSRFPYATDNSRNFQLTRRVILSGNVEANPGPNEANVHQKSKQTNVQCKGKTNGGLKICE